MKIALINEFFAPFTPGGAEWSTLYLAQQLAQTEQVVVITPNYGAAATEQRNGFVVERFAFPFKLSAQQTAALYGQLANPLFYLYSAGQIIRQVRRYHFDILHVQNKQSLVGTVLAGKVTGRPVVASVRDLMILCRYGMCLNEFNSRPQGCDWRTYWRCLDDYLALYMPGLNGWQRLPRKLMALYHRFDITIKKAALNRTRAIVTISDKMQEIYATRGLPPAKMVTIYNPAPTAASVPLILKSANDDYQLLYAGKLSWGKGAHLLLEALPAIQVALAPRRVRLALAGKGPLEGRLKQRAEELGLAAAVTFCGQLPHAELQQLYQGADLVVVPSVVQEGFGRVALEALYNGTPVVVSNRGGLAEIVEEGVTGYVVEPEPAALAGAVVAAAGSPGLWGRVQAALPGLQQRFGIDVAARYLRLYHDVMADRPIKEQESVS